MSHTTRRKIIEFIGLCLARFLKVVSTHKCNSMSGLQVSYLPKNHCLNTSLQTYANKSFKRLSKPLSKTTPKNFRFITHNLYTFFITCSKFFQLSYGYMEDVKIYRYTCKTSLTTGLKNKLKQVMTHSYKTSYQVRLC